MKIAVFHELPEGGAKRVAEEQVKRLKKRHKVDKYQINIKPGPGRIRADFFKFWTLRKRHQQLAEEIDKGGYDVVLVHPSQYTQAPYLLRFLKTPCVYYAHETLRICYEYHLRFQRKVNLFKRVYETIFRFLLKGVDLTNARSADKVIVNSYHTKEAVLKAYGIKSEVCYPGVDSNHFLPLPGIKKEGILFVAKPSRITGFEFLKQVVSLIQPKPKIKIAEGNLSESELIRAYNGAVLTVCTSELEPFGLVPLESMACQTPVVAVKEGGFRESILDGKTGFLVDRDPKEFSQKIRLLLENPDLVKQMGKAARDYVKKEWSWEKSIEKLEEILSNTQGVKLAHL